MDHQTFDRMTRLFGTAGSRRTAWRALLAGALLGTTTRSASTAPCHDPKHLCAGACCPGKCFRSGSCEVCCTKENKLVICGDTCCQDGEREDLCRPCTPPVKPNGFCQEGIAGSYRRRR